ncbi:MAG: response regulator [Clostridia bacterium]|nr:response regulator [Clostridia bacterium]
MSRHILCVDELGITRIELSEMLKKFKVQVSSVKNEVEALNYLHDPNNKVNAIVWTVNSIDLKDFDSIKRVKSKEIYKNLPVVIVSKFTDRKYVIKAIESGACEYIAKPYDELTATKKICGILGIPLETNKGQRLDEDIVMFNFGEMFTREVKAASRGKYALSLMLVSVIPEAKSNPHAGDANEIVEVIHKVIKLKLRETDTVFFYGDGNLIILLPFADRNGIQIVDKKVRNVYDTHTMIKQKNEGYDLIVSTVSFPEDGKIKEKLLEKLEKNFDEAVRTKCLGVENKTV